LRRGATARAIVGENLGHGEEVSAPV
jgi:hypothetical protein